MGPLVRAHCWVSRGRGRRTDGRLLPAPSRSSLPGRRKGAFCRPSHNFPAAKEIFCSSREGRKEGAAGQHEFQVAGKVDHLICLNGFASFQLQRNTDNESFWCNQPVQGRQSMEWDAFWGLALPSASRNGVNFQRRSLASCINAAFLASIKMSTFCRR